MMTQQPNSNSTLRDQILNQMRLKETEELVAIWQESNRGEWTEEALEAVKTVLVERLGELPEQKPPEDEEDEQDDEDDRIKYPSDRRLIWIADLSSRLSWVALGVAMVLEAIKLARYFFVDFSPSTWGTGDIIYSVLVTLFSSAGMLVAAGFMFLVLQAITEVIYLLMDIREISQPDAAPSTGADSSTDAVSSTAETPSA